MDMLDVWLYIYDIDNLGSLYLYMCIQNVFYVFFF